MHRVKLLGLCSIIGICFSAMNTYTMMNPLWPYSVLVRPNYDNYADKKPFQFFVMGEGGIGPAKAYNAECSTSSILRIWESNQNALTMLEGFPATSPESQLISKLAAVDDGTRGHFDVCGELKLNFAGNVALRWFPYKTWSLNFYLPYYVMTLDDVVWQDLTLHNTDADERVHAFLTDNFAANMRQLGCIDICGWQRHGFGDLVVMVEWYDDFPQSKEFLKNVRLDARAGLGVPTGLTRDIDKIFALPFGFDGAFSLPFAGGLELTFDGGLWAGLDVFLIHIFGRTRTERIKTFPEQTSLLFLQTAEAYCDFGLRQEFSLFVGTKDLPEGLSTKIGYQYDKQGESDICLTSNAFSTEIANTALPIKDWTSHQVILRADYDFGVLLPECSPSPRLSLYARLPFNGKRAALVSTIGFSLAVDF